MAKMEDLEKSRRYSGVDGRRKGNDSSAGKGMTRDDGTTTRERSERPMAPRSVTLLRLRELLPALFRGSFSIRLPATETPNGAELAHLPISEPSRDNKDRVGAIAALYRPFFTSNLGDEVEAQIQDSSKTRVTSPESAL